MDDLSNNIHFHANSAFKRTNQTPALANEAWAQIQAFLQQVLNLKYKIRLIKALQHFKTQHPLTHIFIDLVFSVQTAFLNQNDATFIMALINKITEIPFNIFKNICLLIQESLVIVDCKYNCQLSLSMLFEKGLLQTFKLCFNSLNSALSQKQEKNCISYYKLDQFLSGLNSNQYRKNYLPNIYALHSGTMISIQKKSFTQNLGCIITNIGKAFTEKTNLITRNLKNVKKSKIIGDIVSNSIRTICNYKNKEFVNEQIQKVTLSIFGQQKFSLTREKFFEIVESLIQNTNSKEGNIINTLFLYIDLFRVETMMVNDTDLRINVEKQKEINSSNFYTQQMQKLLKKCPYNGDECCDCKKCQCVRRNRESAKLSQQKKRNAVEQLDPLKNRISELERKNKQLQQQNRILKSIVSELKSNENYKFLFNSTIESVSKVLDN